MSRFTRLCAGFTVACLMSPALMASTLSLYEQPSDTAKVIGKIDTEAGFVPIFTQKDGKWSKVGDPVNGNTGWVKTSDLASAANGPNGYSFSQSMVSQGNGTPSMVVRFGKPTALTSKKIEEYWQNNLQQQAAIQRDIQNLMKNFFSADPGWMGYPMVLPVMVVPVQQTAPSVPTPPSSGAAKQKS